MAGGNSSQKFELFFLIFWIVVTVALLALAILRKIHLPNFIRGDKRMSMLFAFLQLVIFVLLLAALAHDQWSYQSYRGGYVASGVVRQHNDGYSSTYNCGQYDGDYKTPCQTIVAAGAFTLIFGLIAIFTSFALLCIVLLALFGVPQVDPVKPWVDVLANVQWISLVAMLLIWGVSGHDVMRQSYRDADYYDSSLRVGDSWILCLVCTLIAIPAAFFFAGGSGETIKGGEMSAPATSSGPSSLTHSPIITNTNTSYPTQQQQMPAVNPPYNYGAPTVPPQQTTAYNVA